MPHFKWIKLIFFLPAWQVARFFGTNPNAVFLGALTLLGTL